MSGRALEELLEKTVALFVEAVASGSLSKAERFARAAFALAEGIRERSRSGRPS